MKSRVTSFYVLTVWPTEMGWRSLTGEREGERERDSKRKRERTRDRQNRETET